MKKLINQEERTKEELNKVLDENKQLIKLKSIFNHNVSLVGGAVIDVLESRNVKDYDVIPSIFGLAIKNIESNDGYLISDSRTAKTYACKGLTIQVLKINIEAFDFTISQSKYNLKTSNLEIDMSSFQSKKLVPVGYDLGHVVSALTRKVHYESKGYSLPSITYFSLLSVLTKEAIENS